VTVWAFSQQDFRRENENDVVGEFWGKSSHYLMPDEMSTHERRVKNRTWRKNFRASLVRLEVIYLSGNFH
jgi:hypothetical protein|tara:strand:- start:53 stop:262 length:210 start_codon:yes stop_codon:yes gene_type:complete